MSIAPLLAEALAKPCAVIIFGGRVGHKPTGGSTHAARFETSMHLGKQQAPRRPPQKKRKAGLHGQSGLVKKSWQRATLPPPSEAVPSPQRVLTSVFGMGTGMTLAPWPPGKKGAQDTWNQKTIHEKVRRLRPAEAGRNRGQINGQASRLISSG